MSDLDNKFTSLGEKHKLEARKMQLLAELTGLCNINFSNVNDTINPLNAVENDAVKQFRNWVKNNMARAASDEVVANIDSGIAMTEIAVDRYAQAKHLINQIRQLVVAAANENLSEGQVENLKDEALTLVNGVNSALSNAGYNDISNIFNGSWNIQTSFIQDTSNIPVTFDDLSECVLDTNDIEADSNVESLVNAVEAMTDTTEDVDYILGSVDYVQDKACDAESAAVALRQRLIARRDAVVAEYHAVHRQLEVQRCEARKRINAELACVLQSVEYMKICICYNPGC